MTLRLDVLKMPYVIALLPDYMNSHTVKKILLSLVPFSLTELFKLADYYDEDDLKRRCEQQLKVLITKSNVYRAYAASFQHKVTSSSVNNF